MSCDQELFLIQFCVYVGTFFIVFGDWLVAIGRLMYTRQGGWRKAYAETAPGWGVPAAGLLALVLAVGTAVHWIQACAYAVRITPWVPVVGLLSLVTMVVAIVRLVRGRILAIADGAFDVSDGRDATEPIAAHLAPTLADAPGEAPRWRVPKLMRRVIVEYVGLAVIAMIAAYVSYSIGA